MISFIILGCFSAAVCCYFVTSFHPVVGLIGLDYVKIGCTVIYLRQLAFFFSFLGRGRNYQRFSKSGGEVTH